MNTSKHTARNLILLIAVLLTAGALRFFKLGEWSFARDETATLAEDAAFFQPLPSDPTSQIDRLPRAIPLSYFVMHIGYWMFGRGELGSRITPALLGTLSVGIAFSLVSYLRGVPAGLITSLLIAFWPDHIHYSQENRFYIIASLTTMSCLLIGAVAAERQSGALALVTAALAIVAVLCHTSSFAVYGVVAIATLIGISAASEKNVQSIVAAYVVGAVPTSLVLVLVIPRLSGWNGDALWGYSVAHSAMASILMIGWPLAVSLGLGIAVLISERSVQGWYWVSCASGWVALVLTCPCLIPYHPAYSLPPAVAPIVVVGYAVQVVYERIRVLGTAVALSWTIGALLLNIPSLVSHYSDGSRPDMRAAALFVRDHWQSGDVVTGPSMGLFSHYASECGPLVPLSPVSQLNSLLIWLVNRGGCG